MRGEVLLLSSNVRITSSNDAARNSDGSMSGDSPRPLGCILVSSYMNQFADPYPDLFFLKGIINIDNVALENCSQEDDQAAINFQQTFGNQQRVSNSAISSGLGLGIQITNSSYVTLDGNVIHDVVTWGIHADRDSSHIVINNNVINGVKAEDNWLSSNQL